MLALDWAEASWRKSSYSSDKANCVEVAFVGPQVGVRDSKDSDGAFLTFPANSWSSFVKLLHR